MCGLNDIQFLRLSFFCVGKTLLILYSTPRVFSFHDNKTKEYGYTKFMHINGVSHEC